MASLDFSYVDVSSPNVPARTTDVAALVDQASLGTVKDGIYEVKDWEFASTSELSSSALTQALHQGKEEKTSLGLLGNVFARLTGSKVLTQEDLKPVLEGMKQHLMKKNVAKEIADKVCEGVSEGLVGKKLGSFQCMCTTMTAPPAILTLCKIIATSSAFRQALSASLTQILTPKTSTDLLLSIRTKLSSHYPASQQRDPYSITFVGVNGVGKSTNLSKVCFWLVQNGLRVLIAACDTFRCVRPSSSCLPYLAKFRM